MGKPTATGTDPLDSATAVEDQFRSLMEGLRTTLPGAQVLFAFLLALPFQWNLDALTRIDRMLYYLAFLAAGIASVLLIAPSAHQRARAFRTGVARHHVSHVATANRLATAGTAALLVALSTAVYLVSRVVFRDGVAVLALIGILGLAAWTWFYQPLVRLDQDDV